MFKTRILVTMLADGRPLPRDAFAVAGENARYRAN